MALPVAPGPVTLRKTFRIMASYRGRFAVVLVLQITAVLSTLVAPQLLGRLVGRVSAGRADAGYVDRIVLTIIAVSAVFEKGMLLLFRLIAGKGAAYSARQPEN